MTSPTLKKFGYPESLIREYDHWCVLLRPAQATLGALVLVCKQDVDAFSKISAQAFAELGRVTHDIETGLSAFKAYEKINYLMLMMVDKDVHFHVLPRYSTTQKFENSEIADPGWPALPDLASALQLTSDQISTLVAALQAHWPDEAR